MNAAVKPEVKPRPISTPYRDRRMPGWWTVDLDNGRCMAFETLADAKEFIRESK